MKGDSQDREVIKVTDRQPIWIIRGAPGIGKSSVAACLKKRLPSSAVIEVDALRAMRSSVEWTDGESHNLGLSQAAALAGSFHSGGASPVIIVDTLADDKLGYLLSSVTLPVRIFTLVGKEVALTERVRERKKGFRNETIALRMNEQLIASRRVDEIVIDSSDVASEEVARRIIGIALSDPQTVHGRPLKKILRSVEVLKEVHDSNNVVFIRHSEKASKESIPPGGSERRNLALTPKGMLDCQEWARLLPFRVDLILASPTLRTMQTAERIMESNNPSCHIEEVPFPMVYSDRERWNQLRKRVGWRELIRRWVFAEISADIILPCRESAQRFLETVISRIGVNGSSNTIVVTHDHVITILIAYLGGSLDFHVGYLGGFVLDIEEIVKAVETNNGVAHSERSLASRE